MKSMSRMLHESAVVIVISSISIVCQQQTQIVQYWKCKVADSGSAIISLLLPTFAYFCLPFEKLHHRDIPIFNNLQIPDLAPSTDPNEKFRNQKCKAAMGGTPPCRLTVLNTILPVLFFSPALQNLAKRYGQTCVFCKNSAVQPPGSSCPRDMNPKKREKRGVRWPETRENQQGGDGPQSMDS